MACAAWLGAKAVTDQTIMYVVLTVIGLIISVATAFGTRLLDDSKSDRHDLWKADRERGAEMSKLRDDLHAHEMVTAKEYVPLKRFLETEQRLLVAIQDLTKEMRNFAAQVAASRSDGRPPGSA